MILCYASSRRGSSPTTSTTPQRRSLLSRLGEVVRGAVQRIRGGSTGTRATRG